MLWHVADLYICIFARWNFIVCRAVLAFGTYSADEREFVQLEKSFHTCDACRSERRCENARTYGAIEMKRAFITVFVTNNCTYTIALCVFIVHVFITCETTWRMTHGRSCANLRVWFIRERVANTDTHADKLSYPWFIFMIITAESHFLWNWKKSKERITAAA